MTNMQKSSDVERGQYVQIRSFCELAWILVVLSSVAIGCASGADRESKFSSPTPILSTVNSGNGVRIPNSSTPAVSNFNSPRTTANSKANVNSSEVAGGKAGVFSFGGNKYPFYYKREGGKTAAVFAPKLLPRDDSTVVAAIREVIKLDYREDANGNPSLTNEGGSNLIRIDSEKGRFYVLLVKEDTGEIHSFVIERR